MLLAIAAVWIGMAVVNTPIPTVYHTVEIVYRHYQCVPVSIPTARNMFIAHFICDYLLPLGIIGFISVSIYRHITTHSMVTQNANRPVIVLVIVSVMVAGAPIA